MATTETHQFQNIMLGGRGGTSSGQLRIHPGGFIWRKTGGGKVIEVSKADISNVSWTRVPRGYQLGVRLKAGSNVKFNGFKEQEVSSVSSFLSGHLGMVPEERVLSVSGRNWGHADLDGNMLSFDVGGKQAFELALADVSQAQLQGKNDVVLEFHVDDTAGANEKDCLMEMTFHVPITNSNYVGDDNNPPAQVFCDKITSMADIGSSATEAVAFFKEIAILTPRGRYSVELHFSFLHLQGFQANDFKIQYNSVVRLFVLPKSNQPHTFLVITLDPPIRKGQTFYPHIVLQFPADNTIEMNLTISEELLTTKYKDRLQASYQGLEVEVFAQILRGLSGAKVTRPGKFRSNIDGYAVRASLKAEDGVLYPLEKAFFFLPKPPTLILHDEIDYLEFERHGAGGSSSMSSHYFDLVVRLKSEQEHQFRNIQRNEYHKLFNFINSKNLRIINLPDAQGPTGVAAALGGSDDETLDPHLERIRNARDGGANDSDEEDEDFVAEKDDAGSPTDDSEEEGSDASEDGDEEKPAKEKRKEPVAPKPTASKKKKREEGEGDGKKKRKKKDPNAPKRAISSFMYFSQAEREVLKKTNPGLPFKEVGKVIGERWKKLSEEEKEPYETSAKRDRDRYLKEMAEYRRSAGQPVVGNDDSAGEESE